MIEVEAVSKVVQGAEGALTILRDITFSVAAGESLAIVGASGSGKSTLLALLGGLDVPSSGRIIIDGEDLFSGDEEYRARFRMNHLGFVFQSFQLLPHLNALENVMLPMEIRGERDIIRRAQDMLTRVGLGERMRHYPKVLSGGEQQRVALARAFVMTPRLLLADEPTGSLDAATGRRVLEQLMSLHSVSGSTLVLVTHDPSIAAACQTQLELAEGRIVRQMHAE